MLATLKLVPTLQFFYHFFIMPCRSISHLVTAYPLGWKQNHLMLATFKLVPRPQFFITSYDPLSPWMEKKRF